MKTTDPIAHETALDDLAAAWIVEREEGFATGRAEAFAEWCGRDQLHADAVARVEKAMALLDEMPAVRAPLEARVRHVTEMKFEAERIPPMTRFRLPPWTAGLAAAFVIGFVVWWLVPTAPATLFYSSKVTEPKRVALVDGSVVDLNANSQVKVQFSSGERQVTLAAGEAHFQVAHNASRPFVVTANGVTVRAIGTAFAVRLVGDEVDVLVTEGKVEIDRSVETVLGSRVTPLLPLLAAGERTRVSPRVDTRPQVEVVVPTELHALLSWQDRMTSFADVPLREMVARFNRCNKTQLVVADPSLAERKIGGVIALNQVEAFILLLEQDGDITADRHESEVILRRTR